MAQGERKPCAHYSNAMMLASERLRTNPLDTFHTNLACALLRRSKFSCDICTLQEIVAPIHAMLPRVQKTKRTSGEIPNPMISQNKALSRLNRSKNTQLGRLCDMNVSMETITNNLFQHQTLFPSGNLVLTT